MSGVARVALVTDSTAYLAADQLTGAPAPVSVVPLHVIVGGQEHREGIDLDIAEIADALHRFVPVTTSRPSPQEFLAAYEQVAMTGVEAIVSVHISAELSATVEGAQLAAAQASVPVHVVDSRVLGPAMGYAVLAGAAASAAGAGPEQVVAAVRASVRDARQVFYVHTLEYLRRGGRIGTATALVGAALAIKPILTLEDGRIALLERLRTTGRALDRMVELAAEAAEQAREQGRDVDVHVQHLDVADRADSVSCALRESIPNLGELRVGKLGAVVGAHVGPGTLAICVSPRTPR